MSVKGWWAKRSTALWIVVPVLLGSLGCVPQEGPEPPATAAMEEPTMTGAVCADKPSWGKGFHADECILADGSLPPIDPTLWPDVCSTGTVGWRPSQGSFDQLSWRSFLALNWPADPSHPGQPDPSKKLGAEAGGAFLPTVWESYHDALDLVGAAGPLPRGCSADGGRVLRMTSKVPHEAIQAVRAARLTASAAGAGELGSIDQAFRGPLVDQSGKVVYYEIRINDVEYDAIIAAGAQNKSPDELNCKDLLGCTPFDFPVGSIEVKAAWKQLSQRELESGVFFSRAMQLAPEDGSGCSQVPMGLVGLHIARKTELSLNGTGANKGPSWAWATFEHAGNVPPIGSSGGGSQFSFYNAACTPAVTAEECAKAATVKPNPDPKFQCCTNLWRYPAGMPPAGSPPNQITRLDPPPPETVSCDAVYAKTALAIWGNYSLVSTQWPKAADGPGPAVVTPAHLRNTTLESYFTQWQSGKQVSTSSCMGCHFGSQAVDMSYLFLNNTGK